MNKLSLSLLALVAYGSTFAQVSLGLQAGAMLSQWRIDNEVFTSDEGSVSLAFGLPVEVKLSEAFAVQGELGYARRRLRGVEFTDENGQVLDIDRANYGINYLDLPLLAKVGHAGDRISAYGVLGPSFGYALSGGSRFPGRRDLDEGIDWEEYGHRRFALAGIVGAQLGYALPRGRIVLDARYRRQLNNLIKDPVNDATLKIHGFSATVGYLYPLGS